MHHGGPVVPPPSEMRGDAMIGRNERWLLSVLGVCACACSVPLGDSEDEVAVTVQALGPSPDTLCSFASNAGRDYWFCSNLRSWDLARTKCQAINLDLVAIQSSAENTFVRSSVSDHSWIGGNDVAVEG